MLSIIWFSFEFNACECLSSAVHRWSELLIFRTGFINVHVNDLSFLFKDVLLELWNIQIIFEPHKG